MLLALSTWPEIAAWLDRCRTIVIPIGSNEQHGPTGLLGTDWLCPEIIAHEAERRGGEILVAPTFNIGMAQHHLAFPGTISLRPSTFQAARCATGFNHWPGTASSGSISSTDMAATQPRSRLPSRSLLALLIWGRGLPVRPQAAQLVAVTPESAEPAERFLVSLRPRLTRDALGNLHHFERLSANGSAGRPASPRSRPRALSAMRSTSGRVFRMGESARNSIARQR